MYKLRKLNNFNGANGLVSVLIRSGFAVQGVFSLSVTDGVNTIAIGNGKFGDSIPDVFTIPVAAGLLSSWRLIIFASYGAAMSHNQISVNYDFYQKGQVFDTELIQVAQNSLSAHHDFDF